MLILTLALFISVFASVRAGERHLFSPFRAYTLVFLGYVYLPAIYLKTVGLSSEFWQLYPQNFFMTDLSFLLFTVIFVFVGMLAYKSKVRGALGFYFGSNVIPLSLVLLLFSFVGQGYLIVNGSFFLEDKFGKDVVDIPRWVSFIRNLHLYGFVFLAIYSARLTLGWKYRVRKISHRIVFVIYLIYTIGMPIVQGRRFGVLFPILVLWVLAAFYRRFTLGKILSFGGIVMVAFAIITLLRLAQTVAFMTGIDVWSNVFVILDMVDSDLLSQLFDGVIGRIGNIYIITNRVVHYVSDVGVTPAFNSFELAFIGFVPAFLLKNKPPLSIGNELGKQIDAISAHNVVTGINAGWVGEGYYNAGLFGVFVSAVMFSIATFGMNLIGNYKTDAGKLVFIGIFTFIISGWQMEIAFTVNNLIKGVFLQLIMTSVLCRANKNSKVIHGDKL